MARLIEQLINEDKFEKAEKVADLAMEKMPVDDYGYYTLLEPYISAYYEIGALEKGRKLYKDVSKKYQENLTYFSGLTRENQEKYLDQATASSIGSFLTTIGVSYLQAKNPK